MDHITLTLTVLDQQTARFESLDSGDGVTAVLMPYIIWVGAGRPTQVDVGQHIQS